VAQNKIPAKENSGEPLGEPARHFPIKEKTK
jgi:hypothetical protein